jgi:hypothetical protein
MSETQSNEIKLAVLEQKFNSVETKLDQHIKDANRTNEKMFSELEKIIGKITDISTDVAKIVTKSDTDHSFILELQNQRINDLRRIDELDDQIKEAKAMFNTMRWFIGFFGIGSISGLATAIQWFLTIKK